MRNLVAMLFALALLLPGTATNAALRVDISRGVQAPITIAVPYFAQGAGPAVDAGLGRQLADVIQADLGSTGFLRPLPRSSYSTALPAPDAVRPRFAIWKADAAQLLVSGVVQAEPGGWFALDCRLFDVFSETQVFSRSLRGRVGDWRRVSHQCANLVYETLVGEPGYFDSRIIYVDESGNKVDRVRRLAEMDYDGANHAYLTKGKQPVSTPRYAASGGRIAYMAFVGRVSKIFILDLENRSTQEVGTIAGMAFGPRFSPDGRTLVMSVARGADVNIYSVDIATGVTTALTSVAGINASANYSPDGRDIVFESSRSGSQQVYRMNADGTGQRRISFGDASYGTPVWSPRGDAIAVTKIAGGEFHIATLRPDGSGERMVSSGRHDEAPSWAANGRAIVFTRFGRGRALPQLWMVDLVGNASHRIETPQGGSDPNWSPARR